VLGLAIAKEAFRCGSAWCSVFARCLGGGAYGSEAAAQTIEYSYDGGTPVTVISGQDFTVNVGTVTGVKLLRIYDPSFSGTPDDDAGKITVSGSLGSDGELRILIAGPSQAWGSDHRIAILQVGLRRLGLDAADGIVVTDADLRAKTRLMAYVSESINGDITLGQIRRMQVFDSTSTQPTGTMTANITSIGNDVPIDGIGDPEGAIGYIIAGDAITGTITAAAPATGDADIERVQVGPNEAAAGIAGDIIAERGAIRTIFTTGPIDNGGTPPTTPRVQINASNGIGQVRAFDGTSGTLLARDIKADITSNQAMLDDPDGFGYFSPAIDGALWLIETEGDLHGEVNAGNLTANNLGSIPGRAGIYVGGICYAPITIALSMEKGNIAARTFMAPITIGYTMKAWVAATGGATTPSPVPDGYGDGRIPAITIGYAELPEAAEPVYGWIARGVRGPSLLERDFPTPEEQWFGLASPTSSHFLEESGVHAANSIGVAQVRAMQGELTNVACTKSPPMLESPRFEELTIDALQAGSVWSGVIDGQDPDAAYATVEVLTIGCMRQMTAAWVRDWGSAVVLTDVWGDIHVPSMPAQSLLQIGRILGDEAAAAPPDQPPTHACECMVQETENCGECNWHWNYVSHIANPRNPWWPGCNSVEDRSGQIIVRDDAGLAGQIVVNASSGTLDPAVLWSGKVQIGPGSFDCHEIEVSPDPSSPEWESPHYDGLSATLGGGAIGLVPFALHRTDCDPPADADPADRTFLNSAFCHVNYGWNLCPGSDPGEPYPEESIVLQFYGQVCAESATERPYEIGVEVNGQPDFSVDYGVWTQYSILPQLVGGANRRLLISGGEQTLLFQGHYYVRPKRTGSARLLCDGLLPGAPETPVADFLYDFWLLKDCNTNGIDDEQEQQNFCCLNLCDPDFTRDGNADQEDIAYLQNIIGGGYNPTGRNPDFNGDGNADQDDLAADGVDEGGGCP
jgi:hypothetical protein